ncbi:GH3 auxin-responsive promoter family protein [Phaeocystidibacter luteus]|uniref:GH3 auxin-responsive promoter family protein n=2 Tax=Phaeocystidibacter luteus TaxID=911197 RepID=A0A6N6RKC7_9FLAO|nr:GH3 auxin-responsive promoter family protein [Phaeocystidibacter luteus]
MAIDPVNKLIAWQMRRRYGKIERFMLNPHQVQEELLLKLVKKAANTEWGKRHNFKSISSFSDFQNSAPLQNYESLKDDIDRIRLGEQNILWPTEIKWFAKSSGTTSSKSKFLPVSLEAIEQNHFKGGRDLLAFYCNEIHETTMFSGYSLKLGGSTTPNSSNHETYYGDLSAVLIENLPFWVEMRSTPNQAIALMEEWESKIEKIVDRAIKQNVTSLFGVPSWMLVLCRRVLEKTGADNLLEVWPNLELYAHGGVSFTPYRKQFEELIPKDDFVYLETYNASEGFFAIQDTVESQGMLLMLDNGIFYEFIPMSEYKGIESRTIPLHEVQPDVNYAMVITTNAGLWRYIIGDTVKFTSTAPYRIEITGRTKLFINAFGEELIIDNAEKAIKQACVRTGAEVKEYTAAPYYMEGQDSGAHEWIVEFSKRPSNLEDFETVLDDSLRELNSDYEAKRHKNMALKAPIVHEAKPELFHQWLKQKGKLGGQHKVPRLANDRVLIEELLRLQRDTHL